MDYVYQLYKNVRTYQDLLDINIEYFNENVDEILTTSIPFNENYDTYIDSRETLIQLTNNKIYYCCGNPCIYISNEDNSLKQRSDIYFLVTVEFANLLKNYLFNDNRIYTSMSFPNGNYIDNMPCNDDTLPLSYINDDVINVWKRNINKFSNPKSYIESDDIDNIFSNLVECSIISVDFEFVDPVENILLSYIRFIYNI